MACLGWLALLWSPTLFLQHIWIKIFVLSIIICLNAMERLAANGNVIVMERGWVSFNKEGFVGLPLKLMDRFQR